MCVNQCLWYDILSEYPRHDGPHVAYDGEQTRDDGRQAALLARLLNTWRSGAARGAPAYTEGGRVYVGDTKPTSMSAISVKCIQTWYRPATYV